MNAYNYGLGPNSRGYGASGRINEEIVPWQASILKGALEGLS